MVGIPGPISVGEEGEDLVLIAAERKREKAVCITFSSNCRKLLDGKSRGKEQRLLLIKQEPSYTAL